MRGGDTIGQQRKKAFHAQILTTEPSLAAVKRSLAERNRGQVLQYSA